jgi:hypothetical protein
VNRSDKNNDYVLAPDPTGRGLVRRPATPGAELAGGAARLTLRPPEENAAKKNSYWLESFKYYAAAVDRARSEDWPDDAWRDWRYRRASLARLLAREGMMQEIADAYEDVRTRYSPRPTLWQRLTSSGLNK